MRIVGLSALRRLGKKLNTGVADSDTQRSHSSDKLVELLKLIGGTEARALIATLNRELSRFEADVNQGILHDRVAARALAHKLFGFANQFYFYELAESVRPILDDQIEDYGSLNEKISQALKQTKNAIHELLIESRQFGAWPLESKE